MTETFCTQVSVIGPALWVALLSFLVMAVDLLLPKRNSVLQAVSILGLGTIFATSLCRCCALPATGFFGMLSRDAFTIFFDILFVGIAFLSIAMSGPYYERVGIKLPETLALKLFATVGAMLMVNANDLMILFLGLELMSICLYVLAGMLTHRPKSNEAAMKYFLLGAFSSGFFLYGIALLYGVAGSTNYSDIATWIVRQNGQFGAIFWAGVGLLLIGFFFKTASVPFHFWSPDAYEGAPTPIAGFFSAGPKAAAFGAFLKVYVVALSGHLLLNIGDLIAVIAFLTMAIGNIVAIQQSSVKRMLAYSSISHAGYLLVAIVAGNDNGASSLLLYLLVYTITNLGAFTVAWLMNRSEGVYSFDDYNGLSSRHPALAGLMALFMVSLAGIPPTGGFFGKYYIFYSVLRTGHLWLAISMALFSAVSVFYYLKVIVHMYMRPATESSEPIQWGGTVGVGLAICAVVILATGLFPSSWVNLVGSAVKALGL